MKDHKKIYDKSCRIAKQIIAVMEDEWMELPQNAPDDIRKYATGDPQAAEMLSRLADPDYLSVARRRYDGFSANDEKETEAFISRLARSEKRRKARRRLRLGIPAAAAVAAVVVIFVLLPDLQRTLT